MLGAMHAFAEATDQRFDRLETRMDERFIKVESQMVTKDYLDEKLWDLRGDMVAMMNRGIEKHEHRLHAA